jgi:hypothetical protein
MWNVRYKSKQVISQFGQGVNTFLPAFEIGESELADASNVCSDNSPAIETRNDRSVLTLSLSSNQNALGQRDNSYLHVLDGPEWKCALPTSTAWTTLSTSITNGKGCFNEFNTEVARYTILATTGQPYAYDGTTTLVSLTSDAPKSNLYTVHSYRMYAIGEDGRTIKHSALGSITDWVTALDAGSIQLTNAKGGASAITTFANHVIVWTDNSMHELYGFEPNDYELIDISNDIGCVNRLSVQEVKGKLYWLDYSGIYQYTGGQPTKISQKAQKWIDGINWTYKNLISMGSHGSKLYIGIPYQSTSINKIIVFDTEKNTWFADDGSFVNFMNVSDTLYGQNSDGRIWDMESTGVTGSDNSTAIPWSFETKAFQDGSIQGNKTLHDLWLVYKGSTNATLDIGYTTSLDSITFTDLVSSTDLTFDGNGQKYNKMVPLSALQNVDWYRLKFEGIGHVRVNYLQKNLRIKGGTY